MEYHLTPLWKIHVKASIAKREAVGAGGSCRILVHDEIRD